MAIFSRYADTNGDGTGTKIAIGDYSGAADDFYVSCPTTYQRLEIERAIIHIEDTTGFSAGDYGNITGSLTNGVEVLVVSDGVTRIDLTDGLPIKTNGEWARVCHDAVLLSWGVGNEFLSVRWTFSNAGAPIVLERKRSESLVFRLNDDFTGLVDHTFMVQGTEYE